MCGKAFPYKSSVFVRDETGFDLFFAPCMSNMTFYLSNILFSRPELSLKFLY